MYVVNLHVWNVNLTCCIFCFITLLMLMERGKTFMVVIGMTLIDWKVKNAGTVTIVRMCFLVKAN